MLKRIYWWLLGLAAGLLLVYPVQAQEPGLATWQAAYWNNTDLSGPPVLRRAEANVDYNWGAEAPAPGVAANNFSARWRRTIEVEPAVYRFTATSDDGMRVWIDNELIIDQWFDHPVRTVSVERALRAGRHQIRVEYYDNEGGAVAQLAWAPVTTSEGTWRGQYYDNPTLSGEPRLVRGDPQINFNWGTDSPNAELLGFDEFSARWTRRLDLPAGLYRFTMTVDDGGRLWVNNRLLIDAWQTQAPTSYTANIYLPGGPVPVRMEYFENEFGAQAQLRWEQISAETQLWQAEYYNNPNLRGEPEVVRDDAEINFNWGDSAPLTDQLVARQIGPDNFSVRWRRTVDLPAGAYRFIMTVDDGGRLWVNGQLLIDAWQIQAQETYLAETELPGGPTTIRIEYFENAGQAVAHLEWEPVDRVRANWRGAYFNNPDFDGPPIIVRDDSQIDFDWGAGSPDSQYIGPNNFSVRWRWTPNLPAGQYCFVMTVDDGGSLLVNNRPVIRAEEIQPAESYARMINISGGATTITLEYIAETGQAQARLIWFKADQGALESIDSLDQSGIGYVPADPALRRLVLERCRAEPLLTPGPVRRN